MSIKCRSCGYINPDNKTVCDNCGCNLKYSRIFERILENEKNSSDFLFEMESSKEVKGEESEFLFDSSQEEAIDTSMPDEDEYKPISFPDPAQEKKSKITKQMEDNEKNVRKIGELISIELVEYFVFFLVMLFFVKVFFSNYTIPNGEIGKSSLIAYLFFNIQSYLLTGKRLSLHLTKKAGN